MFAGKFNQQTQRGIGVSPAHAGRGFTLIESLVSITILLIAVSGPLTVAARGLISANISRDQVTAYFLALEGLELVRMQRDQNMLEGNDWLADLDSCLGSGTCQVQTSSTDLSFSLCPSGVCDPLSRTPEGIYGYYGSAEETTFVRSIQIREVTEDTEAQATAAVSWSTGPLDRTIQLETQLLYWLQ